MDLLSAHELHLACLPKLTEYEALAHQQFQWNYFAARKIETENANL
jgi:hypothetical protein